MTLPQNLEAILAGAKCKSPFKDIEFIQWVQVLGWLDDDEVPFDKMDQLECYEMLTRGELELIDAQPEPEQSEASSSDRLTDAANKMQATCEGSGKQLRYNHPHHNRSEVVYVDGAIRDGTGVRMCGDEIEQMLKELFAHPERFTVEPRAGLEQSESDDLDGDAERLRKAWHVGSSKTPTERFQTVALVARRMCDERTAGLQSENAELRQDKKRLLQAIYDDLKHEDFDPSETDVGLAIHYVGQIWERLRGKHSPTKLPEPLDMEYWTGRVLHSVRGGIKSAESLDTVLRDLAAFVMRQTAQLRAPLEARVEEIENKLQLRPLDQVCADNSANAQEIENVRERLAELERQMRELQVCTVKKSYRELYDHPKNEEGGEDG